MIRCSPADLTAFAAAALQAGGVPAAHADITARRLVEADLRGRTGHGIIRLGPYIARIEAGGVNLAPAITVRHETPVSALIDGDNGLGQVIMTQATELAIEKATASGLAWVGTVASNHAGAAGLYAEMAAEAGLIGIYLAVANSNGMPPPGGTNPLLGTNPIAIAIPTQNHPFVLDIASTTASHGSIKVAAQQGVPLPEGWVVDASGAPITDPARAGDGFLVPMGGYKGAGLTIAFGLLAGVLNGAAFGAEVVDHSRDLATPTNTGQAIMVLRADLFRSREDVLAALTEHLAALRNSGGPVRLPGDAAAQTRLDNEQHGIPIPDKLATDLAGLAGRLNLDPPFAQENS